MNTFRKLTLLLFAVFWGFIVIVYARGSSTGATVGVALVYFFLLGWGIWAYRRAEAWRAANPNPQRFLSLSEGLRLFGGFKAIAIFSLVAVATIAVVLIALSVLGVH